MNVAAVQQHFRDLANFVERAGLKGAAAGELRAVADAFEPFAAHTVAQLGEFLRLAQNSEEYRQTGKLPVFAAPKKAGRSPSSPKPPKPKGPSADELFQQVLALWNTVTNPDLTVEAVEASLLGVDKLTGKKLDELAAQVNAGAKVKAMKVAQKREAIKNVIRERRGMTQRPHF